MGRYNRYSVCLEVNLEQALQAVFRVLRLQSCWNWEQIVVESGCEDFPFGRGAFI
jgi:hypothetical protein